MQVACQARPAIHNAIIYNWLWEEWVLLRDSRNLVSREISRGDFTKLRDLRKNLGRTRSGDVQRFHPRCQGGGRHAQKGGRALFSGDAPVSSF
jgi:hypothetical protein